MLLYHYLPSGCIEKRFSDKDWDIEILRDKVNQKCRDRDAARKLRNAGPGMKEGGEDDLENIETLQTINICLSSNI